jgi:release factor glutamine methyltransferase
MNQSRKLFRKVLGITVLPFLKVYLAKSRNYSNKGLNLVIAPGVFHPGFFFSTKYLLGYIAKLPLKGKQVLELGAGSGLLSFFAFDQGALVTASDISSIALTQLKENQIRNSKNFELIQSDLFENFQNKIYDFIFINPPYYPKNPNSEAEFAWYCGENLDYFVRLFVQLPRFVSKESRVIMVLSEDCALEQIKQIAKANSFSMTNTSNQKIWMEMNYIFEIKLIPK